MRHFNTVKHLVILLLFAGIAFTPARAGSDVTEFNVDGLKVILKHSPKEVISVSLFVEGGVTNYSKAQEGIESMALQFAMAGGTKSLDKTAFNAAAEKTGTEFTATTTYDFGTLDMSCVKMFWEDAWSLFADAVMNPAFDETEYMVFKEQMVSQSLNNSSDPDTHLRNIAMKSTFGGTAYESIPAGTPESLGSFTLEEVANYYNDIVGKKRAFLVVVGDVDQNDLEAKVKASLAGLPQGSAAKYEERTMISEAGSYMEDRDIATNYIRGLMSAPTIDTQDGVAMWVAMSILRDRFFLELRTKRGLTYAPGAFYSTGVIKNPYNGLYVSTLDPEQSMDVMVTELNKIKTDGFEAKELKNEKQTFLTHYYMGQETTGAQTYALGTAEIAGGWELAESVTERVNKVTLSEMNRVFDEYSKTIRWTYLGKADMVDGEDFIQPENTLNILTPQDR